MDSARQVTWKLLNPAFNATNDPAVLPPHPLDDYVPSYRILRRVGYGFTGVDVSIYLTGIALLFGLFKAARYVYDQLYSFFYYNFTSDVTIDEFDDLFDMVLQYQSQHGNNTTRSRTMVAITQYGSRAEDAYDEQSQAGLDESGLFNYVKWSARIPPRYEPSYGRQRFTYQGKYFWFQRQRKSDRNRNMVVNTGRYERDDQIQIDCLGRSIEPIKDFLRHVRLWSSNQTQNMTIIRHPAPKEQASYYRRGAWTRTTSRPSRPMDTVILDETQKRSIIRDMNSFLLPSSPRWYATRGIPYRRGYLFHGPPGTGKTSLTFALAGIFGLDIYVIGLQDASMTESDILQLFNHLPQRCIVLLEDVDAAGLVRDTSEDDDTDDKTEKKDEKDEEKQPNATDRRTGNGIEAADTKKDEEFTLKDFAQEIKTLMESNNSTGKRRGVGRKSLGGRPKNNDSDDKKGTGVSLSGLLNAIDGVASHEGRVLIMTTNHPDKLDHALVRPGRVDLRIGFTLAARDQLRQLFIRMYTASEESLHGIKARSKSNGSTDKRDYHVADGERTVDRFRASAAAAVMGADEEDELVDLSREALEEMAAEFAGKIPDDTLTPAEVQNLLMQYKKQPSKAVARVESWLQETLEEKEKQLKIKAVHVKAVKASVQESEDDSDSDDDSTV